MFLILEGQMRVFTKAKSGEIVFLRMLDAGESFGEVAPMNKVPRSAGVEAVQNSVLIQISAASLEKLLPEQPAIAAQFLFHLARIWVVS